MTVDNLNFYDFYTLRIPTFSIQKLAKMNDVLKNFEIKGELDEDDTEKLKNILTDETFLEGLFLASPTLFRELQKWLNGIGHNKEELLKLLIACHKYYIRMCTRCTPFGMFAGSTTGFIADKPTELRFHDVKLRKIADFDMGFLSEISKGIIEQTKVDYKLRFRANDTLYKVGDQLLFTESVSVNGRSENILSSVSESLYINKVLTKSKNLIAFGELVEVLKSEYASITVLRIEKFLQDLISSQILISELNPQVTGDNFSKRIIGIIKATGQNGQTFSLLDEAYHQLRDENLNLNSIIALDKKLRSQFNHRNVSETLQETLFFDMEENSINAGVIREITKYSQMLWELEMPEISAELNSFKQRFEKKFEGREVPLLHALDTEVGVGYASAINGTTEHMPLLKNIVIRAAENVVPKSVNDVYSLVQKVIKSFFRTGSKVIQIDELDIANVREKQRQKKGIDKYQNGSKFIYGSIIASSTTKLDQGNYKFLAKHLFNYSAGRMSGRFASGDPVLKLKLGQLALDEERHNSEFILAEVLHNPGGHAINVVSRPSLRKYEIPINCSPSVPDDQVINLQDLLVSINNGRIVLRSKSLNREVLPQMTNAFNVQRGEPLLKFLSDLQHQHMRNYFAWNWYDYYDEEYLPRVEFKKLILTRARWSLKKNDNKRHATVEAFKENFLLTRKRLDIPRFVTLIQGFDNELCIDLENDFCLRHLHRHLKHEDAVLLEFLHTDDDCFIQDKDGVYCNEVIIPYGTKQPAYPDPYAMVNENYTKVKKVFLPGSEWLFLKIYGGNKSLDYFLKTELLPLCDELIKAGYIDKWFFIRYEDPDRHLRIRFHFPANVNPISKILLKLNQVISSQVSDNKISKVLIDSYVRELERYTANFMEDSEELFFFDSIAVCHFLGKLDGDEGEENRWMGAVYSINLLLSDFDLNVTEKHQIIQELSNTFFQEFASSDITAKALNYSLNNKYRDKSHLIKSLLTGDMLPDQNQLFVDFDKRSVHNKRILERMKTDLEFSHKVKVHLLKSYIHMSLNRIFLSRSRNHELVIYHFLKKIYTTEVKQQNQFV